MFDVFYDAKWVFSRWDGGPSPVVPFNDSDVGRIVGGFGVETNQTKN